MVPIKEEEGGGGRRGGVKVAKSASSAYFKFLLTNHKHAEKLKDKKRNCAKLTSPRAKYVIFMIMKVLFSFRSEGPCAIVHVAVACVYGNGTRSF